MNNLTIEVCFIFNATVFTFRGCRATNHVFIIDRCQLTGQVINIHKTYIGYSTDCSNTHECAKRILPHRDILDCNGKHNCSFTQNVFNFRPYYNDQDSYCTSAATANVIWIFYNCFNGRKNVSSFTYYVYKGG